MSVFTRAFDAGLLAIARNTRGVRFLRRPRTDAHEAFDLAYVRLRARSGTTSGTPAVVIPGGPGLGSILPYRTLRGIAARRGLDLIMVEHRGVGLSRTDVTGADLPSAAMTISQVIDDIAAVLDHEAVPRAHIVGSSYGSYLASNFGAAHPERVAGMLLDSALQTADELDLERATLRDLFVSTPGRRTELIRQVTETGVDPRVLLDVARAAYELGGDALLIPLLEKRRHTHRGLAWRVLEAYAVRDASLSRIAGVYEFDLVGEIAFRELGYGGAPDGKPFDPALTYAPLAGHFSSFAGEPVDLIRAAAQFDWPLVILAGSRDLRTPPAIAERVAAVAPHAVLVHLENGHSALDTHPVALLNALSWLDAGEQNTLPAASRRLDRLPKRGIVARLPELLRRF